MVGHAGTVDVGWADAEELSDEAEEVEDSC